MFNLNVLVLFSVALALVLFIVYLILRSERHANKLYKVVHSNNKTTLLEEQTVEKKHVLVNTAMFAGEPIRPGDIVSYAQYSRVTHYLNIDFMPLLKQGREKEILKELGFDID